MRPTRIATVNAKSARSGTRLSSGASRRRLPSSISKRDRWYSLKEESNRANGKTKKARSGPVSKSSRITFACWAGAGKAAQAVVAAEAVKTTTNQDHPKSRQADKVVQRFRTKIFPSNYIPDLQLYLLTDIT